MSLSWPHRLWVAVCALGLAACVSTRALYYGSTGLPEAVDAFLQRLLLHQTIATTWSMIADVGLALLAPVGAVCLLWRPRWFLRARGGGFETRPWVYAAIWGLLLGNQGFFDANRFLAPLGWLSLPLFFVRPVLGVAGAASLLLAGALLAPDAADAVGAVVWALALAVLLSAGRRLPALRDRVALALLCLPVVQVGVSVLPLVLPLHGGAFLGEGMAYSFCEAPGRETVFAAVPRCGTGGDTEDCKRGFVEEIDLRDAAVVARHRVLSDDFYGRIEELTCLPRTVQIGMNVTVTGGRRYGEDAMEFSIDDPRRTRTHILGGEGGHRILYDAKRDALLYMGHPWFYRLWRATGELERMRREGPAADPIILADLDPLRDRMYAVEPYTPVRAIDLETLETVARFRHGAGTELAVDAERDRVLVSGFWGVEVIGLADGRRLFRARLGVIGRKPVLDRVHDLVYVPTTGEGKLHVFDRRTFEHLGQIPIGVGTRYPYVTKSGARLFGGNERAHFHWDAAALAAAFREAPDA